MAFQILINLTIAFLWMFLKIDWTFPTFFVGYFWGIFILWAMRRFFPGRLYVERVWAAFKLLLIFFRELILSNIQVIRDILRPKLNIQPGIFAMPTDLNTRWEITLLSLLISLTPGTLVMDISDDNKILYIHAMNIPDADATIKDIKNNFERVIKEVTR
ncbi:MULTISPECIES: Na+/H+ antiporter subunit E [Sutcliffiella]|uniref:Na+/H+ antiporter subunit E n=1 Tax=Sutcliffiella TaxID=2837511 RepID=UPI0022DDC577|nr:MULTISPECIES: Na+/H+ antiporter subunit E [Sutcliffiella]MED4016740.1 Na+/H+ antiporter subunit E [Sutcliffiella cohnii]WBL14290.1 Na+/H+ antiporter subunit E [Sutcliffiella sp. NC1]